VVVVVGADVVQLQVVQLEADRVQPEPWRPQAQQAACYAENGGAPYAEADQQSSSARLVPPSQRSRSSFPVPELVGGSSSSSKLPC